MYYKYQCFLKEKKNGERGPDREERVKNSLKNKELKKKSVRPRHSAALASVPGI